MPGKKHRRTFGRAVRIRRSREIVSIVRNGAKVKGEWHTVYWVENNLRRNRYAVIAPRRAGNAVQRNRLKRKVREQMRIGFESDGTFRDIVVYIQGKRQERRKNRRMRSAQQKIASAL